MPSSVHSVTDTPPSLLPTTPTPRSRRTSKVYPIPTTPERTQSLIGVKASDITTTIVGTQSVKIIKTKDNTQVSVKAATPAAPFSAQDETENKLDQIAQNKMSIWHNAEAAASSDDESPEPAIDPRLPADIPAERRIHRDSDHGRHRSHKHNRKHSSDDGRKHNRKHSSEDGHTKHSRRGSSEDGHKHSRKHSTDDGNKHHGHHRKHSTDEHGHRKSSHHKSSHHRHTSHGGQSSHHKHTSKEISHDDEHMEFHVVTDDMEQQQQQQQQQQRKDSLVALDGIGKATVDDEFDQPIEVKKATSSPTVVVTAVATSSSSTSTSTSTIPSTNLSPAPKLRPSSSQEKLNHEMKSPSPASPMVAGRPPLHVNTATAGRLSLNVTHSPVSHGHRHSSSVGGIPLSPSNLGPPSPASPQHSAYSPILGANRISTSGSSPILSSMRSSFLLPPPTPTSIIHRGSLAMSDPSSPLAHPLKLMRFQTHSSFSPIRSLIDASPSFFAAMVSVFSLSLLCLLAFTIILPLRLSNVYILSWFYTFIPLYALVVSQCWLLIYKIIDNRRAPKIPNGGGNDEKDIEMNKMEHGSINEKTVTFGRLSLKASSIHSTSATSPSQHTRHRSITSLENTNVTHINQRRGSNKYTNVMLISVTTLSLFILTLLAYLESDAVTPIVVTLPLLAFFLGLFLIALIYAERYTWTTLIYKFIPHILWFVFFALVGAKSNGTITASWYTCFIPAYVACIIFIQYIMRLSNHIVISKNTTRSTTLMTSAVTLIVFVVFVSMYLEDNTIMTPVAMFVPLWSCWISSFICCCTFIRAKNNPYEFDDADDDENIDQSERDARIQAKKQAMKEQTLMDRYELDMAYFSDKTYTHHQNNTCFCL